MGCGCKTGNNYEPNTEGSDNNKSLSNTKSGYSIFLIRVLAFSLSLFLLPIIMIAVIWFMFELFILNKEIDMKKIVTVLSSKIKSFNEDYVSEDYDEDDEDDEFTEENYEMVDVEDITPIASK
jgi:ATP-dependent Zn protease